MAIPHYAKAGGSLRAADRAWKAVIHVLDTCTHLTVRARGLECLGNAGQELARLHRLQGSLQSMELYINQFKELMLKYSGPQCPLDVRLATVNMLGHSQFLEVSSCEVYRGNSFVFALGFMKLCCSLVSQVLKSMYKPGFKHSGRFPVLEFAVLLPRSMNFIKSEQVL